MVAKVKKNWTYYPKQEDKKFLVTEIQKHDKMMLSGPVRVDMVGYFPIPKSRAGSLREGDWYISKPDKDNMEKIHLDMLTGWILQDDAIVCDGRVQKKYSNDPRIEIEITEL